RRPQSRLRSGRPSRAMLRMRWGLGRFAGLAAACVACVGMLVASATAASIGANDDTAKYTMDGGTAFYAQMASLGLRQSVLTVRFDPSDPSLIPNEAGLDKAVATA